MHSTADQRYFPHNLGVTLTMKVVEEEDPYICLQLNPTSSSSLHCWGCSAPLLVDLHRLSQKLLHACASTHGVSLGKSQKELVDGLLRSGNKSCWPCGGRAKGCDVVYCSQACKEADVAFHSLLCTGSRQKQTRDFARLCQSKEEGDAGIRRQAAVALICKAFASTGVINVTDWLKDNFAIAYSRSASGTSYCGTSSGSKQNSWVEEADVEAWVMLSSSLTNTPLWGASGSEKPTLTVSLEDWRLALSIADRCAHVVELESPLVGFFKSESCRLSVCERERLMRQPEMWALFQECMSEIEGNGIKGSSSGESTKASRESIERSFCRILQAASSATHPFDFANLSCLVIPEPQQSIQRLPLSCMATASLELVWTHDRKRVLQVVSRRASRDPTSGLSLSLPWSFGLASMRQAGGGKEEEEEEEEEENATTLSQEYTDSLNSLKYNEEGFLVAAFKKKKQSRSGHNCGSPVDCIRCDFETSAKLMRKDEDGHSCWSIECDGHWMDTQDCAVLGGLYLSEGKYDIAAALLIIALQDTPILEGQSREDALHCLATLLLEVVATNTKPIPSAATIRHHWRSAAKLWQVCVSVDSPSNPMSLYQWRKIEAYGQGSYDFLKSPTQLTYEAKEKDLREDKGEAIINFCRTDMTEIQTKKCPFSASKADSTNGLYVCRTSEPIITHQDCSFIVQEAEKYADMIGWSQSRHYSVPTNDVPVHEVPTILNWFLGNFKTRLMATLQQQFPNDFDGLENSFYVNDAFVVKYQAEFEFDRSSSPSEHEERNVDEEVRFSSPQWQWDNRPLTMNSKRLKNCHTQRFLPLHRDQSTHSIVIALNPVSQYEGGGTYFSDISSVLTLDAGCMLSFPGCRLLHSGEPIVSGTRYILTLFLFLGKEEARGVEQVEITRKKRQFSEDSSIGVDDSGSSSFSMSKKQRTETKTKATTSFAFSFFED